MEQEIEEQKDYIVPKVQAGYNYMVFRKERNGNVFHKILIKQKLLDGQYLDAYMLVKFKKGIDLPNKTKIKIRKGFENFYVDKYKNPVFYIQINEFDNIDDAVNDYAEAINNVDDDDLPF